MSLPDGAILICQAADFPWMIPGAVFDRLCGVCHARVMVSPNGQRVLRENAQFTIVCFGCFAANQPPDQIMKLQTTPDNIVPNLWTSRN